jgi:hypothetical protein
MHVMHCMSVCVCAEGVVIIIVFRTNGNRQDVHNGYFRGCCGRSCRYEVCLIFLFIFCCHNDTYVAVTDTS